MRWLSISLFASSALLAQPVISFEDKRVTASNLTPSASAVFFSVAREPVGYMSSVIRREGVISDDDLDGRVHFDVADGVPWKSIWVVLDTRTMQFRVSTPPDFPLRLASLNARLTADGTGALTRFEVDRSSLEVLVVRNSVGAWILTMSDGGRDDHDGTNNGRMVIPAASALPILQSSPSLNDFQPGDLLMAIDPNVMDFFVLTVGL